MAAARQIHTDIPGTPLFDSRAAQGLCAEQDALLVQRGCQPRGLPGRRGRLLRASAHPEQREAVRSRQVLKMLQAGGNAYYLACWPASSGWTCRTSARADRRQQVQFQARLVAAGQGSTKEA
ncbi:hypothetical protein [Aquabacterium sp.]|uniref:hypothetical protein n=1 Tax=Aquabacterium sp. TaxID=1872578 RepID=UPI0037837391